MANDDMILSFIEGDKKVEQSIKGYEFDEYFKRIKGELDTSDHDSEWLMIKAVYSERGKQIECYDPSLEVCERPPQILCKLHNQCIIKANEWRKKKWSEKEHLRKRQDES